MSDKVNYNIIAALNAAKSTQPNGNIAVVPTSATGCGFDCTAFLDLHANYDIASTINGGNIRDKFFILCRNLIDLIRVHRELVKSLNAVKDESVENRVIVRYKGPHRRPIYVVCFFSEVGSYFITYVASNEDPV